MATFALVGLLVSWLHPWKGVTLLLLLAGVVVWQRSWRRGLDLAPAALATAAPLVYYLVLSRADAAWRVAELQSSGSRFPLWVLLVVLAPLAALALAGSRGPASGAPERILRLWPLATLGTYFAVSSGSFHALEGMSLPLAVLCVRGWLALRPPRALVVPALLLVMAPGPIWELDLVRKAIQGGGETSAYYLTSDEDRALAYLERARGPGGVLARPSLAIAVPALTDAVPGRRTRSGRRASSGAPAPRRRCSTARRRPQPRGGSFSAAARASCSATAPLARTSCQCSAAWWQRRDGSAA